MEQVLSKDLKNKKTQQTLAQVIEAKDFFQRARGLMFRPSWPSEKAMWIHRCNSIHTFFMKFSIDVVFVDRKLKVRKIIKNIPPWRVTLPVLMAQSVFEFTAGQVEKLDLKVGDELYVGD